MRSASLVCVREGSPEEAVLLNFWKNRAALERGGGDQLCALSGSVSRFTPGRCREAMERITWLFLGYEEKAREERKKKKKEDGVKIYLPF